MKAERAIEAATADFLAQLGLDLAETAQAIGKGHEDDRHPVIRHAEGSDFGTLGKAISPELEELARDACETAVRQILGDSPDLLNQANERAVAWARERAGALIVEIRRTTLDRVRDLVASALASGMSNADLADLLFDDPVFQGPRALMIARTETAFADTAGNLAGWRATGVVHRKEWLVAQDEVCEDCLALNGKIVGINEQFPGDGGDGPPAHPNCILPGTLVSAADVSAQYKRWFEGEIVRVFIEGGDDLAITPNHPVLTGRGWIPAGELRESDHLFQAADPLRTVLAVDPQNHYVQARIEDVADALRMASSCTSVTMPTAPEHFHGDGAGSKYVHIVRPDRILGLGAQPSLLEQADNSSLLGTNVQLKPLPGHGAGEQLLGGSTPPANRCVSCGYPLGALLGGGLARLEEHGGAAVTDGQADSIPAIAENATVAADVVRDLDARLSGHVTPVKIAKLVVGEKWSGHVFNLETAGGWYLASRVIIHNCRCVVLPVVDE